MITRKAISDILKPLMATGVYKDEQRALEDIVADYVRIKIDTYNGVILQMEKKYGKDFSAFSKDIERKASLVKEDDWMEWKAAITMKEAWHQAFKKLLRNARKKKREEQRVTTWQERFGETLNRLGKKNLRFTRQEVAEDVKKATAEVRAAALTSAGQISEKMCIPSHKDGRKKMSRKRKGSEKQVRDDRNER
jgi:hypothetical protein